MERRRAQSPARWIITFALLISVIVAGGYLALRIARPLVTVTQAVEGPVVQAFYSTGTVEPERQFPIKSNIAGIITKVLVDKGDSVKQGQEIVVVSDPELQFMKEKARAELDARLKLADAKTSPVLRELEARLSATEELLEIANREQARVADLAAKNAASQTDLDRSMDRVKQLWSEAESFKAQAAIRKIELDKEVQVSKAALDIAEWNLEQQTIKSPITGVVLDRPTSLGTRVAVNDRLMMIADVSPDNLVMRAAVDEEDKVKVDPGQIVRMTLYSFPGDIFEGRVARIYDQADAERRTFEVDVELNEPNPRLAPGMTGELAFILAEKQNATVIPTQALQAGKVWIVRDNKLVAADVGIGLKSVERIEAISGIPPGARVLISPIGTMREGQRVRTEFIDPIAAAGLNKPKEMGGEFKGFN